MASGRDLLASFADPQRHSASSEIIRRHSTNRADIREIALEGLDLSAARQVLDLGCGFGFLTGRVCERLTPGARIVGVDAFAENRAAYLRSIGERCRGEFVVQRLCDRLAFPDETFDLVLASYSLYFFPGLVPEIARVLKPDGLFLTITHSERNFGGLFEAARLDPAGSPLLEVIRRFSGERGQALLSPCFAAIERIDYPNALHFASEHLDDLVEYLEFKLPLLFPGGPAQGALPGATRTNLERWFRDRRLLEVEKDDAIFRCRRPCP